MRPKSVHIALFLMLMILSGYGCISTKSTVYFNDLPDAQQVVLEKISAPVPTIQVNDRIEIKIGGENAKTVEYIARQFAGSSTSATIETIVDIDGNIELPRIGRMKVAGLSKEVAKTNITNAYKEYLVNPVVLIKFGDFRYTVLGEVRSPGTRLVPSDKISLLEAIANSGDLTEFAERKKVRIIRDVNNEREVLSIDLTNKNILNSPNYYLHPNDIIYVTPREIKQATSNFQRTVLLFSGAASLITVFLVLFKR